MRILQQVKYNQRQHLGRTMTRGILCELDQEKEKISEDSGYIGLSCRSESDLC
jgi:hypothetical protein